MKGTRVIALSLALALPLAARADAEGDRKEAAQTHKGEAARNLMVSTVALEQAKVAVQGLYRLVDDDDGALDSEHGLLLLNMAERTLGTAATHLQHLTTVPSKDKDAPTNRTRTLTGIARVQLQLKTLHSLVKATAGAGGDAADLEKGVTPKGGDDRKDALKKKVREAWKSLEEVMGDHRKVADGYGVSTRLPTP